jgi:hypothetical protein
MGTSNELSTYNAKYDLLLCMFQFTRDISKEYRYILGESLKRNYHEEKENQKMRHKKL